MECHVMLRTWNIGTSLSEIFQAIRKLSEKVSASNYAKVYGSRCIITLAKHEILRNSPDSLFLSSPNLCVIIVFICDLFVSRDDPLMS